MAIAAPAEAEGPGADFTVEQAPPEEKLEEARSDAVCADAPAPDPLQMLMEDLSGITGALREAVPQGTGNTESKVGAADRASSLPLPLSEPPLEARIGGVSADQAQTGATAETPGRFSPADLPDLAPNMPVEGAAIDPAPGGMSPPETDAMLTDSATPPPATTHGATAVPTEARAARAAVVPVARQIAEAVVTARDDLVEIALAPEELGKIRMVVTGPDHNPHVTVWVERPEILDQLRRNAAVLQECLGDAGMPDATFEFQGDTPSDSRRGQAAAPDAPSLALEAAEPARSIQVAWTPLGVPARLDIRI